MTTHQIFSDIRDNFEFLEDWEDRYKYLIELGGALDPLSESEKTEANKVNGCVSQVWLSSKQDNTSGQVILHYSGDSDAMIVKGLVAILIAYYDGQSAKWIIENDAISMFDNLGLREHLTAQRSNGLSSMVARIRHEAQTFL